MVLSGTDEIDDIKEANARSIICMNRTGWFAE